MSSHRRSDESRLTVVSGPSGVGKGTVVSALRNRYPDVWVSISVTTRPPRPAEAEGVQYSFTDDAGFAAMIEAGALLEWAHFAGYRYGTPRAPVLAVLAADRPALLEIELQGARQIRAAMPDAQLVFLTSPSWAELERRLVQRGTEAPEVVTARLERARVELAAKSEFDVVVCNDDVGRAAEELVQLVRHPRRRPG